MGVTYGLFDMDKEEWTDLGKDIRLSGQSFQLKDSDIALFLADRKGSTFKVLADTTEEASKLEFDFKEIEILWTDEY